MNGGKKCLTIKSLMLWLTLALAGAAILLFGAFFGGSEASAQASGEPSAEETHESAGATYGEDKGHMVYFAVYFIKSKPESSATAWDIEREYAPQQSFKSQPFVEEWSESSTICRFRYAGEDYYIYGNTTLSHYRVYEKVNAIMQKTVAPPQVDILQSKDGYIYAGYTFHRVNGSKYAQGSLLPAATCANDLDGDETTTNFRAGSFDELANITVSVYFYAPATLTVSGDDYDMGRFTQNEDGTFADGLRSLQVKNIPLGTHISAFGAPGEKYGVRLWGTRNDVIDGEKSAYDFEKKVYVAPESGCSVYYCERTGGNTITVATDYSAYYYFTREFRSATVKVITHMRSAAGVNMYLSVGQSVRDASCTTVGNTTTITVQQIPVGHMTVASLIVTGDDKSRLFAATREEGAVSADDAQSTLLFDLSQIIKVSENMDFGEVHLYEVYPVTVEKRTYRKLYGVDLSLPGEQDTGNAHFIGYTEGEDKDTVYTRWTEDAPATFYAAYEYTLSATVVTGRSNTESKKYTFTTRDATLTQFPAPSDVTSLNCEFSDSSDSISLDNELNGSGILEHGKTYTAVYTYDFSVRYDISETEEGTTFSGTPEDFSKTEKRLAGQIPTVRVPVTDVVAIREHYDFVGWVYYVPGTSWERFCGAGDELVLTADDTSFTLYPVLCEHEYTLTLDTGDGLIEIAAKHADTVRIEDYAVKEGHVIQSVTAQYAQENVTYISQGRFTYGNISRDEVLTLEWQKQTYVVRLNLGKYCPNVDAGVTLHYTVDGETTEIAVDTKKALHGINELTTSSTRIRLPYGTQITFAARITADGYNISFSPERGGENKSATHVYTVTADSNQAVTLYVSTFCIVTLACEGEESQSVYKYYGLNLTLPDGTFTNDEWIQTGWQSESGASLKNNTLTADEDTTVTAVRSRFVRFVVDGTRDSLKYFVSGETVTAPSFGVNTVEHDGKAYYVAGWSLSPSSAQIDWDGTAQVFTRSAVYYAVFRRVDGTKTVTQEATLTLDYTQRTETLPFTRYVTYSGFSMYYSNDFSVSDDRNWQNGTKSYSSEEIDFVSGTLGDKEIYAWSETTKLTGTYFTANQKITVGESLRLYALYRDFPTDEYKIKHVFNYGYSFGSVTVQTSASRQSNTFGVYAPSVSYGALGWTNIGTATDEIDYPTEYAPLGYPTYAQRPAYGSNYVLLGFTYSPYSYAPAWTEGDYEITSDEPIVWYAVFKRTSDEIRNVTLTHTFYIGKDEFFTVNTAATETRIGVEAVISYNGVNRMTVNEGTRSVKNATALPKTMPSSSLFAGWVKDPNNKVGMDWSGFAGLTPTSEQTFYALYNAGVKVSVVYECESEESVTDERHFATYRRYDGTVFAISSATVPLIETEFSSRQKFICYTDGEVNYAPTDSLVLTDLSSDAVVVLRATFTLPELYTVTYTVGEDSLDYVFESGEAPVLEDAPEKEGYDFVGWECDGTTYSAGETFTVSGSVRLSAVYRSRNQLPADDTPSGDGQTGDEQSSEQNKTARRGGCGSSVRGAGSWAVIILALGIILLVHRKRASL